MSHTKNYILSSSNYLLKNDLINKYSLKNCYTFPTVKAINLKIASDDMKTALLSVSVKEKLNTILFRTYIVLYILLGFIPKLTVIKKKTTKKSLSTSEDDIYMFEIKLKNKKHLDYFLSKLSIETTFFKENLGLNSLENISIQTKDVCSLNTKIVASQFFEIGDSSQTFGDLNLDKLFIHTNILYSNIPKNTKALPLVKNIFFFG
jgi:hypothetical protein